MLFLFPPMVSVVLEPVSLLSCSKYSRLSGVWDGAGSATGCKCFPLRSSESSSDFCFRFPSVGWVELPGAVESKRSNFCAKDPKVCVAGEGITWAGTVLDDRVVLLNRVGLRIGVSIEPAAWTSAVLLKAAVFIFLFFLTPTDVFPLCYQHARLWIGGDRWRSRTGCRSLFGRHVGWRRRVEYEAVRDSISV